MAAVPRNMARSRARLNRTAGTFARNTPSVITQGRPVAAPPDDPRWPATLWNVEQRQQARQDGTDVVNEFSTAFNIGAGVSDGAYLDSGVDLETLFPTDAPISVSFWFNRNGEAWAGSFGGVIGSSTDWNTWPDGFGVNVNANTTLQFWVNAYTNAADMAIPNDSLWHHVAFSWDPAGVYRGWLDGVEQVLTGNPAPTLTNDFSGVQTLRIGQIGDLNSDNNNAFYSGLLDEIALFRQVLDDPDIAYLYNEGSPPGVIGPSGPTETIAWWRMGDASLDDATQDTGVIRDMGPRNLDMIPRVVGARTGILEVVENTP